MHVRLFSGQLKPGTRDEALQRFSEQILPTLQARDNYARCQVLINPDDEFIGLMGFNEDCGPGLLRELYEDMFGKIDDLLDGALDHSMWEGIIDDNAAPEV